ncbi:MAG TPA: heavy metal-binding domain-containing protein [Pirellulales bacterium]|nr:heavy metal-binding domain-containing protein [Pirellulales bacterium]
MRKLLSMLFLAGAASVLTMDAAWACGGCGMSRGGGYYGGGRAVASRKAMGGGANLAQARPQPARAVAPSAPTPPAARPAVAGANYSAAARTRVVEVSAAKRSAAKKPLYTCPMHPQIQWTGPVDCPICGMKLKLKQANGAGNGKAPMNADEHADMRGMDDQNMGDVQGMDDQSMGGMDDMMCCPGCMGMGGMPGMKRGNGSPKASRKASGGRSMSGMAGLGCGC